MKLVAPITGLGLLAASSAIAQVIHPEDGPPGVYSVGEWKGACRRDGFLGGSDHESCGAELSGASIKVELARTVKGMKITVSFDGCKNGSYRSWMGPKALAAKNRAARLESIINGLVRGNNRKCAVESDLPAPIVRAELADILTETDGLEF